MRNLNLLGVAALFVAFVVGAASCGSPTDAPDALTTLEVACFPAADVWIDGDWKGSTPISVSVEPGSHDLTLRQGGFAELTQTVQIEAGGHAKVDEVLIAQDLDDPEVVGLLARAFDVTVEPFQAPDTHRGGRRAPSAILLWPLQDVRAEGLDTFGIEVSEEYDGDGYLVFRKGRKILYKEPFDPDAMTTVATIPLDVLSEVDVGDKVTWGLVFDARRQKAIEGRFKVVNRPKADKRLEKIAHDRHLARQPALTRAMVKAKALENYRLYTEALVAYLEIAQDDPTNPQPYQGIVTTLRRLEAKDCRLWQISAQYVSGRGRGRTGRAGIAAFAPQGAHPLPVPTVTPSPAGETRPLGPGDRVTPGLLPVPETGAKPPVTTPPPAGDTQDAPTPRGPEAAALLGRAHDLALAAGDARGQADEIRRRSEEASTQADHSAEHAAEAEARFQRAQDAVTEAEQDHAQDPSPENDEKLQAAREALHETQGQRDEAADAADQAQQAAEKARHEADAADAEAGTLEARAAEARREAEGAGLQVPSETGPAPAGTPTLQDAAQEAAQRAKDAEAEYLALKQAAEQTGSEELQAKAEESFLRLEAARQTSEQALAAYQESATSEELVDLEGAQPSSSPEAALKNVMQQRVSDAWTRVREAEEAVEVERRNAMDRPGDADAEERLRIAEGDLAKAKARAELVVSEYRTVIGEEPGPDGDG